MKLLNECYRHGLNDMNEFILDELDYYENSFIAFQIYFKATCDCVINTGKKFAYTPEFLDNLWVNCNAKLSFIEAVMTEKGLMYDRLEDNTHKIYQKGEDVLIWVYSDEPKDIMEISFLLQKQGEKAKLIEHKTLLVNRMGKIPLNDSYLDLWMHPTTLARYYHVEPYSERHFEILKRYLASLIPLGVKTITVIASDAPWNGQSKLFNGNYIANIFENNMVTIH